ncbi:MAG: S-layer homology domain-containing protein [Lachnospiraceae bacterium]|nr:S-layer homology domain-containing protein [Lachnospiraceae bacterium]
MNNLRRRMAMVLALVMAVSVTEPVVIRAAGEQENISVSSEIKAKKTKINQKTKTKKNSKKKAVYITNKKAIVSIWEMAGSPVIKGTTGFSDVKKSASYAKAVRFAVRTGVLAKGKKFKPSAKITRKVLVSWLWNYSGSPESAEKWKDNSKIAKGLKQAAGWAKEKKLLDSITDKKFNGNKKLTEEEINIIFKAYKKNVSKEAAEYKILDDKISPTGIAFDDEGYLMITDSWGHKVWKAGDGSLEHVAGKDSVLDVNENPLGGYNDGAAKDAFFKTPWGITPFLGGWAVADTDNGAVRLLSSGSVLTINGSTKENIKTDKHGVVYGYPTGLTTDKKGNLYICDTENGAIRVMDKEGNVTTLTDDLYNPMGICYYKDQIYVAETSYNRVVSINTSGGAMTIIAGRWGNDGIKDGKAMKAMFSSPQGITVGNDGTVYVADTVNAAIRKIKNGRVTTLLKPKGNRVLETWPASPIGLALLGNRLYVADTFARKIYIINV